jgi:hypothetical protein
MIDYSWLKEMPDFSTSESYFSTDSIYSGFGVLSL